MPRADADAERRDWSIEGLVPGGDGFLHLADGRAAFVTGAFPGDVIRPLAVEAKKGHVRATRFELLQPGPHRTEPACPVWDRCGGCDWMTLERGEQLVQKEQLLRAALSRTGRIADAPPAPMTAVGPALHYRSRVRFHVDRDGAIGFYARGTRAVVEIPGCIVCADEIDATLAALRRVPREVLAAFSEIEVRRADAEPRVSVGLVPRIAGGAAPSVKAVRTALPASTLVRVLGESDGSAVETQEFPLPEGVVLRAEPSVFTQVNWPVNQALVAAVVEGARERGVARFFDAYAGAGNFSLPLLAAKMRGISVEQDRRAVEGARATATALGLEASGFLVGDAARMLAEFRKRRERFDLVLLDPPRSGARDALPSVLKMAPPFVAICACDPVTLARDVGTLAAAGYRLDAVRGFDMFPQTHHLEALAWLSRARAPKEET